jgi:Flp pilus assembly protein TadG
MLSRLFRTFPADRQGNVAVTFALALAPMLGLAGLAVDISHVQNQRGALQQILDAAVLAGAGEPEAGRIARAGEVFGALTDRAALGEASASFTNGATTPAGQPLKGDAVLSVKSRFGWSNYVTSVHSEALAVATAPVTNTACYLVLDPTGSQAFLANSGAKITAPECQIDVASNAIPAAIVNAGTTLTIKKLCINGQRLYNGAGPEYQTGCETTADPLAGKLPVPATGPCTYSNQSFDPQGGTREVNPGVWCGWNNFNGAQTVRFKPGLYVIRDGDITLNAGSTISGADVTFYFIGNTNLRFNGTVTANLAAPTSGPWAHILMAEAKTANKAQFIFNGVQGSLNGMLYLPNREVVLNSASKIALSHFMMVSHRLILNESEWTVTSSAGGGSGGSGTRGKVVLSR